jgi:hypothetical protein
MDGSGLARPPRNGPGSEARDGSPLAPGGLQGRLALEIPKKGRATQDRPGPARTDPAHEPG